MLGRTKLKPKGSGLSEIMLRLLDLASGVTLRAPAVARCGGDSGAA